MKTLFWLVPIALVLLIAWSVFFTVDETQYAIVTRFGAPYQAIKEPGLNVKWPYPIDSVVYFDKRVLVTDMPRPGEPAKEYLTRDKKNIEVTSYTCWRISDPNLFLESTGTRREAAEANLDDIVIAELGKVLGNHDLSQLVSINADEMQLPRIMANIRDACAAAATERYGIEIVDFRIKRVNFPMQNRTSVFERMRAERKRIATKYRSEGEAKAVEIRAEADKEATRILAEAGRLAQETEGKADAEAARIYAESYGRDPEFYEFLRTLESYEKTLKQGTTIFLPADSPYLKWLRPETDMLRLKPDAASQTSEAEATDGK